MSDRSISLNAAIDAVNSIDNLDAKARGGIYFKLMSVPSAQPSSFSRSQENDPISRRAAIDGLEQCEQVYINNLPILVYKEDVYRMIIQLMPVQTERKRKGESND